MSTLTSSPTAARDLRRAWLGVAFIPVFFLLAFAIGEGLYSALGYDASAGGEPAWVLLLISVVTLAVFVAPCAAAAVFGHRARAAGERRALVPYLIGGVIGLWFVILTVVTTVDALTS